MPNVSVKSFSCSVSILSSHLGKLVSTLEMLQSSAADSIHFDVMDGHFVPNLTFGYQTISQLRPYCKKPFDVHLMISNPGKYIEKYAQAGAEIISIHREISADVDVVIEVLKKINACGVRASLAYNPDTVLDVHHFLPHIQRVLLMSVYPGFGGQKFILSTFDRGVEVVKIIAESKHPIELQVDGGVNESNIVRVKQHGFTHLVAGSYVVDKNFPDQGLEAEFYAAVKKTKNAIASLQAPLK